MGTGGDGDGDCGDRNSYAVVWKCSRQEGMVVVMVMVMVIGMIMVIMVGISVSCDLFRMKEEIRFQKRSIYIVMNGGSGFLAVV